MTERRKENERERERERERKKERKKERKLRERKTEVIRGERKEIEKRRMNGSLSRFIYVSYLFSLPLSMSQTAPAVPSPENIDGVVKAASPLHAQLLELMAENSAISECLLCMCALAGGDGGGRK